MNIKQKIALLFLLLGLVFSSLFRMRFNLSDGFEFHNFWITIIPSIFDYASSSNEPELTSTFFGYILFVIFGLLLIRVNKDANIVKNTSLFIFLTITFIAFTAESWSLIQDVNSNFSGKHFRIGPILFLVGFYNFVKSYRTINNLN